MKSRPLPTRKLRIGGAVLTVPRHVVRLDGAKVNGWQVRYRDQTRYFRDGPAGARASLASAVAFLREIYAGPALRRIGPTSRSKYGGGISLGRYAPEHRPSAQYSLHLLLPIFGRTPRRRSIYVGTDANYQQRLPAVLRRAKQIRKQAEEAYAHAQRQEAKRWKV